MSTTLEPVKSFSGSERSTHLPTTRRTSNGTGKLLIAAVIIALLAGGAYFGRGFITGTVTTSAVLVVYEVKPQDMDIVVVERGSLESSNNKDLLCEVEARSPQAAATTILWIIKEGTEVKKGDKLVELDSASLQDQITQQKLKVEQARSALIKTETELEITRSQNESDIQTAQIAVELADIDLSKYLKGDYEQQKRNIEGEILIAREELKRAQDRLVYSERLNKKNYVSDADVEADRLAVTKAQNARDVANEKLRVLDDYDRPRTEKDLTNKRDEARRKLDRVRNEAKAKEKQAEVAMLTQKGTTETEESTLRKLERQLDRCVIYAPIDGMVVYANDPSFSSRGGQPQVQIEEGASLRERQKIIRIPDLEDMLVNVKVHEAKVAHVRSGQPAKVKVESMPNRIFQGSVRTVATTADAQGWMSTGVQLYTVMISVDEKVEGLKPGMTAEVEIQSDRLSDVLAVPVQAVVEREGQNYCYVVDAQTKTPTPRRVEIGATNDKMVVIKDRLSAGEKIVENLLSVIKEDELGRIAKEDAERFKPPEPEPGKLTKAKTDRPPSDNGNGAPAGIGQGKGETAAAKSAGAGGGAGGGMASRLLQQYDNNQDGKISLADEVPEERQGFLKRLDKNGDGVIDADELAAAPAPRPGAGQAGGFPTFSSGADWIKASDKNSDGKVTKDDLPDQWQQFWSTMDMNGDGYVDGAEADALVQRMKDMQRQFQSGGGQGQADGLPTFNSGADRR